MIAQAPCLYLHAPGGDTSTFCGLGVAYPERCRECEQYQEAWAPPDAATKEAWRLAKYRH